MDILKTIVGYVWLGVAGVSLLTQSDNTGFWASLVIANIYFASGIEND